MAEQTFDVYGDLEEFELQQVVKETNDAHKKLEEKYDFAIQTIKKLQNDVKVWMKKCHNIEKSFWSLLETSKAEIKRKDSQLDALRRQRDDVAFRRIKHNNRNNDTTSQKGVDHGNIASTSNFNPIKCASNKISNIEDLTIQQQIEQTDLRNRIINLKKAVQDECKQIENSHYANENRTNKNEECIISDKQYSRDSHRHRDLNHHDNYKDENCGKRNDRHLGKNDTSRNLKNSTIDSKYANDPRRNINSRSPERSHRKDDNKFKNYRYDNSKASKTNREIVRPEKHNQNPTKEIKSPIDAKDNERRDSKRTCKLTEKITSNNSKESIKLLVTISNSNTNDKKLLTSPTRTPIVDLTSNISHKKEIANKIPKTSISNTCEKSDSSANNLISELMKDLRKLNNNNNNISPAKIPNAKSFEDVLFDNMVCGDEILSVAESKSDGILNKNFDKSNETPLENSCTIDLSQTPEDSPIIITETENEIHDCEKDIFEESLNELMKSKNQMQDNQIDLISRSPAKLFGTNLTTAPKNSIKYQSLPNQKNTIEIHNDNNSIQQNPLNTSATKFYELYLESPVKKILDINEKTSIGVSDNIQNEVNQGNLNNNENSENEASTKIMQSNENANNNQSDCNKEHNIKDIFENNGEVIEEILNSSNKANNENKDEIISELAETICCNQNKQNDKKFNLPEKEETEILQKIKTNSDVNENNKAISNENSDSITTPTSMSPNQKETIAATKYLTEMLQKNTPSKTSSSNNILKMRMELLFGDTTEPTDKIISNIISPTKTCNTDKNNDGILKTSSSKVLQNEYFCKQIVEDNVTKVENQKEIVVKEVLALPKETEIVFNKTVHKNAKGMQTKRKADVCPESVPSNKKLKKDNTEKDLKSFKGSQPENERDEIQCVLNDTESSLRETKRTTSNTNKDSIRTCNQEPLLNNTVVSFKSQDQVLSKNLMYSPGPDDRINNDTSESDILTVNIIRKKRKTVKKNTVKDDNVSEQHKKSKPQQTMETIATSVSKFIDSEQIYSQENNKSPQTYSRTMEERNECIKNYKIPKLSKITSKNNSILPIRENLMKNFKIPKIKKKSETVIEKVDEIHVIKESSSQLDKEEKQKNPNKDINIKLPHSENCNNLEDVHCEKGSNTPNLDKKFENDKSSTPKQQNNVSIMSKNDEELFDCIFKSPLQVSIGNNSPQIRIEHENSGGNSENLKYNQIEEDFRNLFGKSPLSKSSLNSPSISINDGNENYSIHNSNNPKNEKALNSQTDDLSLITKLHTEIDKCDSENNIHKNNNSSSSINESSILKHFSTSAKDYQMIYDENEGITTWVITRKKIKKRKKNIT